MRVFALDVPGIHVFEAACEKDVNGRDTWCEDALRALPGH